MTETPPIYKGTYKKISPFMAIYQFRTKLFSLLSNPFKLQVNRQLSWITLKGVPLNTIVQEAHKKE